MDLWLLPASIARVFGLKAYRDHVDVIKELGGVCRGPAPMGLGLVYALPARVAKDWADDLRLIRFD